MEGRVSGKLYEVIRTGATDAHNPPCKGVRMKTLLSADDKGQLLAKKSGSKGQTSLAYVDLRKGSPGGASGPVWYRRG
jgi:hypothetical protein